MVKACRPADVAWSNRPEASWFYTLRRRGGQRLVFFHDINSHDFQRLVTAHLGVVNGAGGNRPGVAGLQMLGRLAVDNQVAFALDDIAGFESRMGVAPAEPPAGISAIAVTVV